MNTVNKNEIFERVLDEGRAGYANFVEARINDTEPRQTEPKTIQVEEESKIAEQEKFDRLMETVDKFEGLAGETKKIEKELHKATSAHDEHYNSTNSLGRVVLSDNRREGGLVALKAEVGQGLEELIALKENILERLSQLTDKELREKVYERFLMEKKDEVGMLSEVLLETKSDRHIEGLKQSALLPKALDDPLLAKYLKKKQLVNTGTDQPDTNVGLLDGITIDDKAEMDAETKASAKAYDDVKNSVAEEAKIEKTPAVALKSENRSSIAAMPKTVINPEQKAIVEPEQKAPPQAPVELMDIGTNGEPTSITNSTGQFAEDPVPILPEGTLAPTPVAEDKEKKITPEIVVDKIREEKEKIKDRMKLSLTLPSEPIRNIQDIIAPTPKEIDPPEQINVISEKPLVGKDIQDSKGLVDSRLRGNDKVESGNDKMESGNDKAESGNDDSEITFDTVKKPNENKAESIAAGQNIQSKIPETSLGNKPAQRIAEAQSGNVANNVIDVKPAIEAQQVTVPVQPVLKKRGLFGFFGGREDDRVESLKQMDQKGIDSALVRSLHPQQDD